MALSEFGGRAQELRTVRSPPPRALPPSLRQIAPSNFPSTAPRKPENPAHRRNHAVPFRLRIDSPIISKPTIQPRKPHIHVANWLVGPKQEWSFESNATGEHHFTSKLGNAVIVLIQLPADMTATSPNATTISVQQTLDLLDNDFSRMAQAFANGEFALWVGSGISRKAPGLKQLIARALEHLRAKVADPTTRPKFEAAFDEALRLGNVNLANLGPRLTQQFRTWPDCDQIEQTINDKYSELLDIRIEGEPVDYMLWEAVNIRDAFYPPHPPTCEHLSIAVLILEGAIKEIASANWDGFIEAALIQLSGFPLTSVLDLVVSKNDLRPRQALTRLLKFHGCIVKATTNPTEYRDSLVATKTEILRWSHDLERRLVRNELVALATNKRAITVGLSIQDENIQGLFSQARVENPWPWPCSPEAQAHVFCEDRIGSGQRQILKSVYGSAYNQDIAAIEKSALLRAWGEQVLLAMALKIVGEKLISLMEHLMRQQTHFSGHLQLSNALRQLRTTISTHASGDRTAFVHLAVQVWSRMISLFRSGNLPSSTDQYLRICATPLAQLGADANAQAAAFGELAVGLALCGEVENQGHWRLGISPSLNIEEGAFCATSAIGSGKRRPIVIVSSAAVALDLDLKGALSVDNTIVLHSDDAYHRMRKKTRISARSPARSPGRTGAAQTVHVSIRHLLQEEVDPAALTARFVEEVVV